MQIIGQDNYPDWSVFLILPSHWSGQGGEVAAPDREEQTGGREAAAGGGGAREARAGEEDQRVSGGGHAWHFSFRPGELSLSI